MKSKVVPNYMDTSRKAGEQRAPLEHTVLRPLKRPQNHRIFLCFCHPLIRSCLDVRSYVRLPKAQTPEKQLSMEDIGSDLFLQDSNTVLELFSSTVSNGMTGMTIPCGIPNSR